MKTLKATDPYEQLEATTTRLIEGLSDAATSAGLPHQTAQVGSMFTLFFNEEPVTNYDISARNDTERFATYFQGMLERGVYLPCSQFEANFVSVCHTDEDIDATITAAREVLTSIAR